MPGDKLEGLEMPTTKSTGKTRTPTTERTSAAKPRAASSASDVGDEVLTLAEAADFLRVTQEDVVRSIGPFGLPGRRIGDQWRFLKSALQAWLATAPMPSSKEALLSLAGAWKDDPYLDELRQHISAHRGQAVRDDDS